MMYDSALQLQSDVFSKILGFTELPAATSAHAAQSTFIDPYLMDSDNAAARARKHSRRRLAEDIALGISVSRAGDDSVPPEELATKLAVLVQNRREMGSAEMDRIRDMAKEEVEFIYIGRQQPLWTRKRSTPLRIGCSISPTTVGSSGTLGCFCKDKQSGTSGILSNNHVLANVNQLQPGAFIMQQGALDKGKSPQDDIGTLVRYVPIQFGGLPNTVDAAFAETNNHGRGEDHQSIFDNSAPPASVAQLQPNSKVQAVPGMKVLKTGRTTGHTLGRVRAVNINNLIVHMGVGIARFDGQIAFELDPQEVKKQKAQGQKIGPFGARGDSGSIIADRTGQPVALLFSGSQSGGTENLGIIHGCPILSVEAQLNVSLI
nr:hypothetical protein [uncultured Roseibium sp.]